MFKVNKLTDYATVVLIEIARSREVRSSQHLADKTGIPGPTVAKLMKSLNKAGLVASRRGAGGGYALGRAAGAITIADVIQRLPVYKSLNYAGAIVLSVGFNDLRYHAQPEIIADYKRLLAALPEGVPLVMSAILPIDETAPEFRRWPGRQKKNIVKLNSALRVLCAARPKCDLADAGPMLVDGAGRLAAENHVPDGVHLSAAGYKIWSNALSRSLKTVRQPATADIELK